MYIVTFREIGAVVRAAALFAPERRPCDEPADREQARRTPPLVIERLAVPRRIADAIRRIVAVLPRLSAGRARV